MNHIPDEWLLILREYLISKGSKYPDRLSAYDFPSKTVRINFEDGSMVSFRYAFYLKNDKGYVMVFTEHCGYHIFYPGDGTIEILNPKETCND